MRSHLFRPATALAIAALASLASPHALGYVLIGGSWPSGKIAMQLQLDATAPASPTLPLIDGSTSWNAVAISAMTEWNPTLTRSKFDWTTSASTTTKSSDGTNNVFFSDKVYGQSFGTNVLAVTLVDHYDEAGLPAARTREADLIVNNALSWNSYPGPRRSTLDLRRVLLHELGHVLGLDHPDLATPAQFVSAIMNSTISNLDTLQGDDKAGVGTLYGTALQTPAITQQPTSRTAAVASGTSLTIALDGVSAPAAKPGLVSYRWLFRGKGGSSFERLSIFDTSALGLGTVQLADAGTYYLEITTPDATVLSNQVTLDVTPVATSSGTTLANLSTRGIAGSGSSTMIVGFVVTGSKPKTVLLRSVGPTLNRFGLTGTLGDPKLTVLDSSSTALATSATIWDQSANAADIRSTSSRVGAFDLTAGSRDAVLLLTLPPGTYTAQTNSPAGSTGLVLVEAYDADTTVDPTSRLANLSTRGYVGSGDRIMIAGFSVRGSAPHTYLIRLSGVSLNSYGVTGTIPDPILSLFDSSGAKLRVDDDWDAPSTAQPALYAAFKQAGAFLYDYPSTWNGVRSNTAMQSAMIVTLPPGSYTAQATGNDNEGTTATTGNALVEIYELD
jgi:hypothetical protein